MESPEKKKVVVLHSGGLDSTVCMLLALSAGNEVVSLGVSYNQAHNVELNYAAAQCTQFGVDRKIVSVGWSKPAREVPRGRSVAEIKAGVSSAFLPGRNGIFLMLACAEAAGIGASEVWTGINSVDFSGYPDCRPEFIASFRDMLKFAIPNGPILLAPLQNMSKPEIAKIGKDLGLRSYDTWSCYRPKIADSGYVPCRQCDACKLHEYAWQDL